MLYDYEKAHGLIDVVFHAELMRALDSVKWVDDETMLYCQYQKPLHIDALTQEIATEIHQAKKIEVMLSLRMIVINPIEGTNYGNAEEKSGVTARIQQFGRATRPKPR